MKIIQKQLKLSVEEYYKTHFNIINAILPIKFSDRELEVLASFMSLEKSITGTDMFNSYARKIVKEKLNLSSAGLSNHLKSLLNKGFISKESESGRLQVKGFLIPEESWQGYQLKIIKE